ncbi:MAG TPA: adenylate/guanylate cyclase domain-containing protein [Gaiellaceae bacterium]|nr:adenylate/guanylate cyclase domain-containing protein [Gaiellaceae bacterium]
MRDLPSGTVTLLFTDIEGSTRLLREHGQAYGEILADHRRASREAFARHGGVEVDTQGDAFFVAFRSAADAVAAAAESQRRPAEGPVRFRIGIHTGEPILTSEGYVGLDVHRAARVAACGHGGQVVLSAATRALLHDSVEVRDLGEHRLKDLGRPERLFQLGHQEFPPLRTLDATNLPVAAGPLLGRERELEELLALFADGARAVTVTGPGGTGKTRFALQVAAELVGTLADGVFWVPLAALADPELVRAEIAQAVGAPDELAGFLRDRELLLLLDNFEHLLDAAGTLGELLAGASRLRVLVTSRAPLRISAEREYALDPLPPAASATLFVERARRVGRELAVDETVFEICRRLDGLPLAIELAAARTKLLGPAALLERLDHALPLLTSGTRDAPERQRTLRATIAWSYDLLEPSSRKLFSRLSVLAGGFPLVAAEEICECDLDDLASLVDLSLLKSVGEDRFLMLDTIREYAAALLQESGEVDELRRRHARFFGALAESAYSHRHDGEAEWAARLETDHDDLRAALDWLAENDPEAELELAGAVGWFWLSHAHFAEGRRRLEAALARPSSSSERARARARTCAGPLAARTGDLEEGRELLDEALAAWKRVGDDAELADALDVVGWLLVYDASDDEGALSAFEQSLDLQRTRGDRKGETRALVGVCQVLVAMGEVARAEALSWDLLELARAQQDLRSEHFACHFLADCSLLAGDCATAEERYLASLQAALPLGDVLETSFEVQGVAMAAAGQSRDETALLLAAAVEGLWDSLGLAISVPFWDALLERYVGAARQRLGEEAEAVWAEGRSMGFDDAVALGLGLAGPDAPPSAV